MSKKTSVQNDIQHYLCPPCGSYSLDMAFGAYDEDLHKNPYFSRISLKYPGYMEKALAYKGVLCVPKYSIACRWSPSLADMDDHLLFPATDVNDDDEYLTFSNKEVGIVDGRLVTKSGFPTVKQVTVLFAETFHTDNGDSYKVLCIDGLLNSTVDTLGIEGFPENTPPVTYKKCLELLWSHPGGHKARDTLDNILAIFAASYARLEGESLRNIVDAANTHFTKSMQLLLKSSVMRQKAQQNPFFMDNLKLAVETYMMNSVHKFLFPVITATVVEQDSEINKINRNLLDLRPSELGIRKIFRQNIPPARKELNSVNLYSSPMEKLLCLKRVVAILTRPPKPTQDGSTGESVALLSTDDLLPILIFLIITSEIPNWTANLVYMQHFHFSKISDDDEFGFCLASVEAALEHIKSKNIKNEIKPLKRERWNSVLVADLAENPPYPAARTYCRQMSHSALDEFFKLVRKGDVARVQEILQQPHTRSEEVHQKLCHPLCSCTACDTLLSHLRGDPDLVTVYSRDTSGYTALHVAAYYGQGEIIDFLVQNNAIVDTTDYLGLTPLHLACQRGIENAVLHLLCLGADVTVTDSEGNSTLHFCCANGHEDCAKTLLFHEDNHGKLDVNSANEYGDTALHLAAKWGYESVVKMLLENGADARLVNKRKQTPVSLAQNVIVQRLLQTAIEVPEFLKQNSLVTAVPEPDNLSSRQEVTNSQQHERETRPCEAERIVGMCEVELSQNVQTVSLEATIEHERKCREEQLFKAVIDGDNQQVKYSLGVDCNLSATEDDSDSPISPSIMSHKAMCHPLCQCDKCLLIQESIHRTGHHATVNSRSALGLCPIHLATLHGHSDTVNLLIACSADVNVQNHANLTALHLACYMRNILIMHLLLRAGAKLNVHDAKGNTPLLVSASNQFSSGVHLLLQAGANVNSTNHKGNSALHEAVKRDDLDVSVLLLDAGADPRIQNTFGKIPLDETDDPVIQSKLKTAENRMEKDERNKLNNNNNTMSCRQDNEAAAQGQQMTVQELFSSFEEEHHHRHKKLATSTDVSEPRSSIHKTTIRCKNTPLQKESIHKHVAHTFSRETLRKSNPVFKGHSCRAHALSKSCDPQKVYRFSAHDDSCCGQGSSSSSR